MKKFFGIFEITSAYRVFDMDVHTSLPFKESFPSRQFSDPYPEALASFFRSWYVYTAELVEFLPWRVMFTH